MEYYDDDYEKTYDGYEEHIEPVNLVAEICTESDGCIADSRIDF